MNILTTPQTDFLQFKELCVRYADLINSEGLHVTAYDPKTINSFSAKSPEVRERAIESLSIDILILESMRAEGISLQDSRTHTERFVSMWGYTAQPDIFDKIEKDDSVEIYIIDGGRQKQIFRNLRVIQNASFSIDQLYGIDWKANYLHEPEFVSDVSEAIELCLTAPRPTTVTMNPRPHILTEINSSKTRTFLINLKYLSPLLKDGKIRAFLNTKHTRILASAE